MKGRSDQGLHYLHFHYTLKAHDYAERRRNCANGSKLFAKDKSPQARNDLNSIFVSLCTSIYQSFTGS